MSQPSLTFHRKLTISRAQASLMKDQYCSKSWHCGFKKYVLVMGSRQSALTLFDWRPPSPSKPRPTSGCWYKLSPPSYNHNWTDLHYAASHGNVRRIQEVIHKAGTINVNKKDYYGKTPLYWAAYKGHKGCIVELLKFGAQVNTQCRHGGTPLHAVVSLYPECAILLIKHGANVNLADNWGVTPMYLAATNAQLDVLHHLIIAGAHLTFRNKKTGEIPKQLACQKELCDKLVKMEKNPANLQQLCRNKIRKELGEHPQVRIMALPLPWELQNYVALAEIR